MLPDGGRKNELGLATIGPILVSRWPCRTDESGDVDQYESRYLDGDCRQTCSPWLVQPQEMAEEVQACCIVLAGLGRMHLPLL